MRIVEDKHNTQSDLNKLKTRSEINRMQFNPGHCKILFVTGNNKLQGNMMKNSVLQSSVENTHGKKNG